MVTKVNMFHFVKSSILYSQPGILMPFFCKTNKAKDSEQQKSKTRKIWELLFHHQSTVYVLEHSSTLMFSYFAAC